MPRRGARRLLALGMAASSMAAGPIRCEAQSVADSAWTAGDFDLAEQLYAGQLAAGDASPRALHRLALMRAWSERYDESLELFDRLALVQPDNLDARLDRARVMGWRNDLEGAAEAYLALLRTRPGHREAMLGLARIRSWAGDLAAAEGLYAELLDRDPQDRDARVGHARMAAWSGDLSAAEARWREALAVHPEDATLLAGLGETLRWQGRPSAAIDVLERALSLEPDHAEARQEHRLARLAVAPRLGPSLTYESDSEGNRIATLWHDQTLWPFERLAVNTTAYARTARSPGRSGESYGGLLELRLRTAGGWEIDAGAGGTHTASSEGPIRPQWRGRIATPGRHPAQLWIRHWRRALDETATLMRNRLDLAETTLGVRATLGRVRGQATLSLAEVEGGAANRRRAAWLEVARRFGPAWTLGASARTFGFDEDRDDGYFDPSLYALFELQTTWTHRAGHWQLGWVASPGIQIVERGSRSVSAAARTRASLGYEWAPGRLVSIYGGYSSTGLHSFASGGSDYRHFSLAVTVGWAF